MERLRDTVNDQAIVKATHLALDEARYLRASQALAGVDRDLPSPAGLHLAGASPTPALRRSGRFVPVPMPIGSCSASPRPWRPTRPWPSSWGGGAWWPA